MGFLDDIELPELPFTITRRGLIRAGAAGVAVAATVGVISHCNRSDDTTSDPVVVDERAANNILAEDSASTEVDLSLPETNSWTLPVGTVLRPSEGTWVPALAAS